jgi:hypothetical protein
MGVTSKQSFIGRREGQRQFQAGAARTLVASNLSPDRTHRPAIHRPKTAIVVVRVQSSVLVTQRTTNQW